jgi:hypothetical protein
LKNIYIYLTAENWNNDKPEVVILGSVVSQHESYIEIRDEKGYMQIINIQKVFAVVY